MANGEPNSILAESWHAWADRIRRLTPEQLTATTRCAGWTVHDVIAHATPDPDLLAAALAARLDGPPAVGDAAAMLRFFNQPGGVAESMAPQIASAAATAAPNLSLDEAARRFDAAADLVASAAPDPDAVVPYPAVGSATAAAVTDVAIVEATVHALDVIAAVGGSPPPDAAVTRTRDVLAQIADPVALVDALAGRADPATVLPVIR